jgi:hypothetical protein
MKTDNGNQTTVRNIQIRQTYIEEQVNHILNYYDYEKESEAFQAPL